MNANPAGTDFCLGSGVFNVTGPIVPKTGNSFTGIYGAILDGSGWQSTDRNTAAFRADGIMPGHRVDDVTIRNLVIRNMPQRGINAYRDVSRGWVIDRNEIHGNTGGVAVPLATVVSHNFIHHNAGDPTSSNPAERGGGYGGYMAEDVLFLNNEIAYNGPEQKMVGTKRVTFRGNYVHHNYADGIWFDADNVGALIEGNVVTDNGRVGIDYEISGVAVIRGNVVERNVATGIFISTSKDTDIYGNIVRNNGAGIGLWLTASAVGQGTIGFDLTNNFIHHNEIRLRAGTSSGFSSSVPSEYYTSPGKGNRFVANQYLVPDPQGRYWQAGSLRVFRDWQILGHDTNGTVGI